MTMSPPSESLICSAAEFAPCSSGGDRSNSSTELLDIDSPMPSPPTTRPTPASQAGTTRAEVTSGGRGPIRSHTPPATPVANMAAPRNPVSAQA